MIETLSRTIVKTRKVRLYTEAEPFRFEVGERLGPIDVAFETYGELNNEGTNCILVCHALTGSAHAAFYNSETDKIPGWWDGIIGLERLWTPQSISLFAQIFWWDVMELPGLQQSIHTR